MKNIKKPSFSLGIALFVAILFSCSSSDNNTDSDSEIDSNYVETVTEQEADNELEDEIIYSKFEQYATILTRLELSATFGLEQLEDITVSYAEGAMVREASILTNPQNGQVVKYVWEEDNSTTSFIEASYNIYNTSYELIGTQKIETENGLTLGMSMLELKDWNGADFKFTGFGWDFGGSIYIDKDSKINKSPVEIRLDILTKDGADFTIGDVDLMSSDSKLFNLDIIVSDFSMYIKSNEEEPNTAERFSEFEELNLPFEIRTSNMGEVIEDEAFLNTILPPDMDDESKDYYINNNTFFSIGMLLKTDQYTAIIYRQKSEGDGIGKYPFFIEYILMTYNSNGEIISKKVIGEFSTIEDMEDNDQQQIEASIEINSDFTIISNEMQTLLKKTDGNRTDSKAFSINNNGEIIQK